MDIAAPISSVVFEHNFDKDMLEQIDTLRTIRLHLAEKMLKEIDHTAKTLSERGLIDGACDAEDLRKELADRVSTLKSRMARPDLIYADEVSMYVELLEQSQELDELDELEGE